MSLTGTRVLVTGADGFIGSHLVEALVRAGARVRAFCYYNSNLSRGWLDETDAHLLSDIEFVFGDIRDARFVEAACANVEVVFHLAALIAIPYSYMAPQSFVDTNVSGTLNLLEAVRRAGCARLVHTSTSEVYGTPETVPITEQHALKGQSPYSASKIAADKLCEAYHCSFGVPVVTLRPFNTFGPRQSLRAVIPTILTQLLVGRKAVRLGNVTPKRDLTYIDDTVCGFLAAAAAPGAIGRTIQLGTGTAVSIAELFDLCREVVGSDAEIEPDAERLRPPQSEVMLLQSNATLAAELLGWQAQVSLRDGLARTADWLRPRLHAYETALYAR